MDSTTKVECIVIENILDFVSEVGKIKKKSEKRGNKAELLFRGQSRDWPLLPKLLRSNLKRESVEKIEELMLSEFKRGVGLLSEYKPENDWDFLALAQHHGLATRLLDWSYSSLVALWFAVNEPSTEGKCAVVWVLNAEVEDFVNNIDGRKLPYREKTIIYRPNTVSRRISAQSGVFTIGGVKYNEESEELLPLVEALDFCGKSTKLIKLEIPCSYFDGIRESLKIMRINASTVYPDLDGFCKHLNSRFVKINDICNSDDNCCNKKKGKFILF